MMRIINISFFLFAITLIGCKKTTEYSTLEGIQWKSMESAQERAPIDGKKILVNVYTDWCEYCKKLDDDVFPDSTVVKSLNGYFYGVRLNADSEETVTFNGEEIVISKLVRDWGVRSYPTILFIDEAGEIILQISGYMPVSDFQNLLTYIGEEAFTKTEFHEFTARRSQ